MQLAWKSELLFLKQLGCECVVLSLGQEIVYFESRRDFFVWTTHFL
jgi:hypothetical protein